MQSRLSGRAKAWLLIGGLVFGLCGCATLASLVSPPPGPPPTEAPITLRGTGPTTTSSPFTLWGGAYTVAWTADPPHPWPFPAWHFGASVHDPASDTKNYTLLFSKDTLPTTGPQSGVEAVSDILSGTYVLGVAAGDTAAWTITIRPAR